VATIGGRAGTGAFANQLQNALKAVALGLFRRQDS